MAHETEAGGSTAAVGSALLYTRGCPVPRWRCKLPEAVTAGPVVGRCGRYIAAGGRSGRVYVWNAVGCASGGGGEGSAPTGGGGGELLRVFHAHHRPVRALTFDADGGMILTGGADGVVHAWSLLEILSSALSGGGGGGGHVGPVRTFSDHHLPVTALCALPSGRALSASSDRRLCVLDVPSGATAARLLLPSGAACLTADGDGRAAYVGGADGVIYRVDLDAYALATAAEGAKVFGSAAASDSGGGNGGGGSRGGAAWDPLAEVLGGGGGAAALSPSSGGTSDDPAGAAAVVVVGAPSAPSYLTELRGHSPGAVAALALLPPPSSDGGDDQGELLASGGSDGTVRIWDVATQCCVRTVRPWGCGGGGGGGAAASSTSASAKTWACPVTSISVVPESPPSALMTSARSVAAAHKTKGGPTDRTGLLMGPLRRFPLGEDDGAELVVTPAPTRAGTRENIGRWEEMEQDWTSAARDSTGTDSSKEGREGNGDGNKKRKQLRVNNRDRGSSFAVTTMQGETEEGNESEGSSAAAVAEANAKVEALRVEGHAAEQKHKSMEEEASKLRSELEEARATIERWEKVNQKLAKKLRKTK